MTIEIVQHAEDKKDLVELFNRRMREAGSPWGFYVNPKPSWIPPREGQKVWRELYLAIENGEACVGGYALKPQVWRVHGEEHTVTDWQGPFSLGAIDNRYAALGLRMVRDMLKKQPLLYSWGHGGNEEPIVQMLKRMGWLLHPTPFVFRVCRPANFLRKNAYLRQDPKRAVAQDVLAFSGLGTIGMHALHKALRAKSGKLSFRSTSEVVPELGPWADEIWQRVAGGYEAIAVRDADTMNALVPREHATPEWPAPTRLRVRRDGKDIGWAIVVERQKEGDNRFGDMRVGIIADCLASVDDAGAVVHAAFSHLREIGVDMVMANHSHPGWVAAFEDAGFLRVDDRRVFCAAPALEALLQPWERTKQGLFLTNMDGHGPMI